METKILSINVSEKQCIITFQHDILHIVAIIAPYTLFLTIIRRLLLQLPFINSIFVRILQIKWKTF
jgi:hypothetical protein